jgi:hypothetical protein
VADDEEEHVDSGQTRTARLVQAIDLASRGDRDEARLLLEELWDELAGGADAVQRCAVAHHLADLQDDPRDELVWDLRALAEADVMTPEAFGRDGAEASVAALYPSLHLNLGEDHRRLGDLASARHHLELGRRASTVLDDDGYARWVRRGLDGLAARLP